MKLTYDEILIYDGLESKFEANYWELLYRYAKFDTAQEAEIVIKKETPRIYVLSYGEFDPPVYQIKPYKDKFVIYKETFYQSGIYNAEESHILTYGEAFPYAFCC